MSRLALLALAVALPLAAQAPDRRPADLVVTNARIYTVDDAHPVVAAMAVRDGRVQFTGSAREALALRGPGTRVVDLGGRTVIPGMVDAHAHLLGLGEALRNVDLVGAKSYDEVVARVAAAAKGQPAGAWILGRGWDQNDWGTRAFRPTRHSRARCRTIRCG
jgi:predicted amidohydrolase YtcJ